MSTTPTTTPLHSNRSQGRRERVAPRPETGEARTRRSPRATRFECAPTSMLDEARRRMKANMQALASLLRFDAQGAVRDETEVVLTDIETRLQSMAALHRSLCRFGDFEQIDLAVYLRHAARLRNSPPRAALPGGWAVESDGSLIWVRDEETGERLTGDLETALESAPPDGRELARRALLASAILFPPWAFGWRSPQPGPSGIGLLARPGEVGLRLRANEEGVLVEITVSDRGPGLPDQFDARLQRKLALELTSVLARLVKGSFNEGPEAPAAFEVRFVPSYCDTSRLSPDPLSRGECPSAW